MTIGIRVGSVIDEIGAPSFLHAFFSTISVHGEPKGWGSQFPNLIGKLYQGRLPAQFANAALAELKEAKTLLARLPPAKVVWDVDNRVVEPPWGTNISSEITNLANYFVTSTGRDLFSVFEEALADAAQHNEDATIE